jgi:glutamyl-tRNA synthetase
MSELAPVRVRFAPSPTGHVHLGSARTALYDYLIARQTGGQFILRIEDTDRKRLVDGAEAELIEGLHWLGIDWDEGPDKGGPYSPYRQSERKEIYQEHARKLIDSGKAYYCFCSLDRLGQVRKERQEKKLPPHYDGLCRLLDPEEAQRKVDAGEPHVVRFKSPRQGKTVVNDVLRGKIEFDNKNMDDFILVKTDGWALYHLAAIVDDHLMKITHVIRGSEWLPTSPLHALIWRAFGWQEPAWVHLSVFLKPSGKGKMSKREAQQLNNDGYSIFIKDLENLGYLPEAVNNWVALMGWSYDDRTEFFTMEDLIEKFSLDKLNPSPAAINFSKLDHFNKLHIKNLSDEELAKRLLPYFLQAGLKADMDKLIAIAPALKDRIATLDDSVERCTFLFTENIQYRKESLLIKDVEKNRASSIALDTIELLQGVNDWQPANLEKLLTSYMETQGLSPRQYFSFLREAISGQQVTPPLFDSMVVLGKETTLKRLEVASKLIS